MEDGKNRVLLEALESQLENLKSRLSRPDASHWRQMGKLAQDFTVWLERAKPWMTCAAPLIALRVEQIVGELDPEKPSLQALRKFSHLLEEAGRHLANPGLPIQVIDLETERISMALSPDKEKPHPWPASSWEGVVLPAGLVEIPEVLRPQGYSPVHFRFVIPN
jgi:hypothetical protein